MAALWLERLVDNFWNNVGGEQSFPRNLEAVACWALPLAFITIPELWVTDIKNFFIQHKVPFLLEVSERQLHGCLVALNGKGFIFINGTDSENVQRFTVAHEISHFLLDYYLPRQKAINFLGPNIIEVLDGLRPPTIDERITAVLSMTPIGFHTHLMDKNQQVTWCSEEKADLLALELLAPGKEIWKLSQKEKKTKKTLTAKKNSLGKKITKFFGLPEDIAKQCVNSYLKEESRRHSVKKWLGFDI